MAVGYTQNSTHRHTCRYINAWNERDDNDNSNKSDDNNDDNGGGGGGGGNSERWENAIWTIWTEL